MCGLPVETTVFVSLYNFKKLLDCFDFWVRAIAMPLQVCTLPVDFPYLLSFDIGSLCYRRLDLHTRFASCRAYFENLDALTFDAEGKIEFVSNVSRRPTVFNVLADKFFTSLYFKFTECHIFWAN